MVVRSHTSLNVYQWWWDWWTASAPLVAALATQPGPGPGIVSGEEIPPTTVMPTGASFKPILQHFPRSDGRDIKTLPHGRVGVEYEWVTKLVGRTENMMAMDAAWALVEARSLLAITSGHLQAANSPVIDLDRLRPIAYAEPRQEGGPGVRHVGMIWHLIAV